MKQFPEVPVPESGNPDDNAFTRSGREERRDQAQRPHVRRAHPDAVPAPRRKRIVAPDGSAIVPTNKPQPNSTLIKTLARAWRWQKPLDAYTSVSEIAEAEGDRQSYVSNPQDG